MLRPAEGMPVRFTRGVERLEFGRTWWEGLLQLIRLLWVIKSQCVEVTRAADFELGLDLAASYPWCNLLYAGLC